MGNNNSNLFGGILIGMAEDQARYKIQEEERKYKEKLSEKQTALDYFKALLGREDLSDDAMNIVNQGYQAAATGDWGRVKKVQEAMQMLKPSTKTGWRPSNKSGQIPRNAATTVGLPNLTGKESLENANSAGMAAVESGPQPFQYQTGAIFKTPQEQFEEKYTQTESLQDLANQYQMQHIIAQIEGRLAEQQLQNQRYANEPYPVENPAKPGTGVIVPKGNAIGLTPWNATQAPTAQSEAFMLNGKRALGEFQPSKIPGQSKRFFNGQDVTGKAEPLPQSNTFNDFYTQARAESIVDAIQAGKRPPDMSGLGRGGFLVAAAAAERGLDLYAMEKDWIATKKHLSSLNSTQQLRLRQAVTFTYDSLDIIERYYNEWKQLGQVRGVRLFNKLNLAASKQVAGREGAVAQALESQIKDLVSELGTVYKGGNTSTDESLKLAAENLQADWNDEQFATQMANIRTNLSIRKASIETSQPQGLTPVTPQLEGNTNEADDIIRIIEENRKKGSK